MKEPVIRQKLVWEIQERMLANMRDFLRPLVEEHKLTWFELSQVVNSFSLDSGDEEVVNVLIPPSDSEGDE